MSVPAAPARRSLPGRAGCRDNVPLHHKGADRPLTRLPLVLSSATLATFIPASLATVILSAAPHHAMTGG
eukprot:9476955-Pyramimonas_sp.AAC.1